MKNAFLIALIVAISSLELASTSSVSSHGLKLKNRRAVTLKFLDALTPNSDVVKQKPAEASPEAPEGRTWIKITNVSKLWPDKSNVPVILQYMLALTWICIMAAIPFILPVIDNKPVTSTQKVVGASLLTVLFGGLYLFTNVILFQSIHFEKIRPLTVIECIYFMSQVITTVGYGDITPAKTRGQIFVALYVLGALFVIAMLVSEVIEHCTMLLHKQREKLWGSTPRSDNTIDKATVHDLLHPEKPSPKYVLRSLAVYICLVVCWVTFFANFPGEEKTVFQAFYMSLITMTTVGFGAITPLTEEGMIFASFFMLVGSAAIVNVIGRFCEFVAAMNDFQRFGQDVKKGALEELRRQVKEGSKVTALEFFRFVVLHDNVMTEGEVDGIMQVFEGLNPKNGEVAFKKVEEAMEVDRDRSKYFEEGIILF